MRDLTVDIMTKGVTLQNKQARMKEGVYKTQERLYNRADVGIGLVVLE